MGMAYKEYLDPRSSQDPQALETIKAFEEDTDIPVYMDSLPEDTLEARMPSGIVVPIAAAITINGVRLNVPKGQVKLPQTALDFYMNGKAEKRVIPLVPQNIGVY